MKTERRNDCSFCDPEEKLLIFLRQPIVTARMRVGCGQRRAVAVGQAMSISTKCYTFSVRTLDFLNVTTISIFDYNYNLVLE